MTPLSRLLGNSALYLAANIAMRAMTLVLAPLYTRVMNADAYGELAFATTIGAVLSLVASLALPAALARYAPSDDADTARLTTGALLASLVPAVLLFGAGFMYWNSYMRWVMWTSAFAFPQGLAVQYFAAREAPKKTALLNLFAVACWLGASIYFVAYAHRGFEGALIGGCLAQLLVSALAATWLVRDAGVSFEVAVTRRMLEYALPLVPHLLSNWVLSISDRALIERINGKEALAPYAVAYFFNLACVMGTSALQQALAPIFVREAEGGRVAQSLPRLGDVCVLISVAGGVVLCVLAPWLFPLLAPRPEYAIGLSYVPWLVLGAVFQSVYFVGSQGSWYAAGTKLVPIVTAVAALVNVAFNLVFLPRLGPIAAAYGTALAYGVLAILHIALARRLYPVAWHYGRWVAYVGAGSAIVWLRLQCAS